MVFVIHYSWIIHWPQASTLSFLHIQHLSLVQRKEDQLKDSNHMLEQSFGFKKWLAMSYNNFALLQSQYKWFDNKMTVYVTRLISWQLQGCVCKILLHKRNNSQKASRSTLIIGLKLSNMMTWGNLMWPIDNTNC